VLLVVYYCCSLIIAPHRFLQVRGNYIRCILWYIVCYCFPHQLPPSEKDATQSIAALCDATSKHCFEPLKELVKKLNSSDEVPLVTSIMYDGLMGFAGKVARELNVAEQQFWTASACGLIGYLQFDEVVRRGIIPFQGDSFSLSFVS